MHHLLAHGCDGVLVLGTTGEALSFSTNERMHLLDALLDASLPAGRLMVGTGACALPDAVALTRHAVRHGVGGVLVMPPLHVPGPSGESLRRTIDHVVQAVGHDDLRVYLYHYPQLTRVPFSFQVINELVGDYPDTVVGIKDSSQDRAHIQSLCETFGGLHIFAGTETLLLDALNAGGNGCISATANLFHRQIATVYARWQGQGDAREAQEHCTALRRAVAKYPMIPAIKALLARHADYAPNRHVRLPMTDLSAEDTDALHAAVQAIEHDVWA